MVCSPCPPWNPHLISPFTLPCRTQCARTSSSAHTKPLPSHPAPSKIFQARKGCHGRAWAAMADNILRELHSRRAPISHRSGHYEFIRATVSPRVRTSKPIILLSCRNHSTSPLFRPRGQRGEPGVLRPYVRVRKGCSPADSAHESQGANGTGGSRNPT